MKRDEEKRHYQKRQGEKATCHLSTITQSQRTIMIIHNTYIKSIIDPLCLLCVLCAV